ncbi:hypothetical protein JCM6882_001093 [Rhodosporidiobolus microsporus]
MAEGVGASAEALTASLVLQALPRSVAGNTEIRHLVDLLRSRVLLVLAAERAAAAHTTPHNTQQTAPQTALQQEPPSSSNGLAATTTSHPPPQISPSSRPADPPAAPAVLSGPVRASTSDTTAAPPAPSENHDPPPHLRAPIPTAVPSASEAGWQAVRHRHASRGQGRQPKGVAGTTNQNPFQLLPTDIDVPNSSFAAAAASPAQPPAPAAVPQPSPARTAPAPTAAGRQTAILSTATLADDDKFRTLPLFFLLAHARKVVKAAGADGEALVGVVRLERGDLRAVVKGGEGGAKALAALAYICPVVERTTARKERTILAHFVPGQMTAAEFRGEVQRWAGGGVGRGGEADGAAGRERDELASGRWVRLEKAGRAPRARDAAAVRTGSAEDARAKVSPLPLVYHAPKAARRIEDQAERDASHLVLNSPSADDDPSTAPPTPVRNRNTPRPPLPGSPPTPSPTHLLTRRAPLPVPLNTPPSPIAPRSVNSNATKEATPAPTPTLLHEEEGDGGSDLDRPFTPPRKTTPTALSPGIAIVSSLPPTPSFELSWHESDEVDDSAPELKWEEGQVAALFRTPARDGMSEMGWREKLVETRKKVEMNAMRRKERAGEEDAEKRAAEREQSVARHLQRRSLGAELERAEKREGEEREEAFRPHHRRDDETFAMKDLVAVTYNLRKSVLVWDRLTHLPAVSARLPEIDLLLLQEPPTSLPSLRLLTGWTLLSPPAHDGDEDEPTYPRAAILVSPRFPPAVIAQLPITSRDVVGVDLRTRETGSSRRSSPPSSATHRPHTPLVVAGDFNLRHGEWDPLLADPPSPEAEDLRLTLEVYALALLRPAGEPTYFGFDRSTPRTLDLVFGNLQAEERMVSAAIDEALECGSDHRPIRLSLRVELPPLPPPPPRRLYRKVPTCDLLTAYDALAPLHDPTPLLTPTDVDNEAEQLTTLLRAVVDRAVPLSKPRRGSRAAPWWTADVAEASAAARRARNVAVRRRGREDEEAASLKAKVTAARLRALVQREKARAEREELAGVTSENLWRTVKRRLGGESDAASTTPPLRRSDGTYAVSTSDKLDLLRPILLPEVYPAAAAAAVPANAAPAPTPTSPTPRTLGVRLASTKAPGEGGVDAAMGEGGEEEKDAPARRLNPDAPPFLPSTPPSPPPRPPPPADAPTSLPWPDLKEEEVRAALFATRPFAVAGPDEVSNHVLRSCWPSLRHRLVPLLAASLRLGHVPPGWKEGTATVLRKPKKPDYASPKAYRLIVFGQSTAKLLEAVVARRIAHLGEGNEEILPKAHYGGRRCRSAEDAAVAVDDEVKRQWRAGRVVVAMAVDLAKAFPSVLEEKVAEALREAGFGEELVGWVREWMRERSVRVWFEGVMSGRIDWRSGLPQGSPLSPTLFLVFIAALLRRTTTATTTSFGWVDDVNVLAWGKTVEEAAANLQAVVPEMESWAGQRGATFEPEKTTLTLFSPPQQTPPASAPHRRP